MAVFQYLGAFYRLIHPNDEVDVGTFGIAAAGTGKTRICFPNIVNTDSRFIWQTKTGGGNGQKIGSTGPGKATISRGEKRVQRAVYVLNNWPGLYIPGWKVGDVAHPNLQKNDIPLQVALHLCGSRCIVDFVNNTRAILWVPEGTQGVLAYELSGKIPRLKIGTDPIIAQITSVSGQSWKPAAFRRKVEEMLKAGPPY